MRWGVTLKMKFKCIGVLGESGCLSDDALERQLSHSERNNVRTSYIHTSEHLNERRLMLQWRADYLETTYRHPMSYFDFAKNMKEKNN